MLSYDVLMMIVRMNDEMMDGSGFLVQFQLLDSTLALRSLRVLRLGNGLGSRLGWLLA